MKFSFWGQIRRNWAVSLVLLISVVARALSALVIKGESGGDFYNYLLMGKSLLSGGSIFIEKRLPVYALLLIPGHLIGQPLDYARILGIVLSLLTLYFLYRLILDLHLPEVTALTSLILLSLQPTFFIFSIRPLSHTLFDLEVILSLFLFYRLSHSVIFTDNVDSKTSRWQFVAFGLVLGLTAMTRHEGFLVAGVLIVSLVVFLLRRMTKGEQRSENGLLEIIIKPLTLLLLPFVVITVPWFISNYLRFGNFIYTEYETDAGLNIAKNIMQLQVNLNYMKQIFLGIWGDLPFFSIRKQLLPIALVIMWLIFGKKIVPKRVVLISGIFGLAIAGLLLNFTSYIQYFSIVTVVLMAVGFMLLIKTLKWEVSPLIIFFISQFSFLTVVQPWSRHSQHTFFLMAIFLSLGLCVLVKQYVKPTFWVLGIILLPIFYILLQKDLSEINNYQIGGNLTWPLVRAASYLEKNNPDGLVLVSEKTAESSYYLGQRLTTDVNQIPQLKYFIDYNDNYLIYYFPENNFTLLSEYKIECHRKGYNDCWAKVYEVIK